MGEEKKKKETKTSGWVIACRVLAAVILLLVLLPLSLYIPWVQNVVKNYACEWASEETGMEISIDRILIKFPLDVSIDGVLVLDQQKDTLVQAQNLTAGIAMLPLFKLQVEVDEAELTKGYYRMVAEDSSMHLKARVDHALVSGIGVDLNKNAVTLAKGALTGGDISLDYFPYLATAEKDTTQTDAWHIEIGDVQLHDINYTMQMLPTIDRLKTHVMSARLSGGVVDTGAHTVDARYLGIDSVDLCYFYPSTADAEQYDALHPVPVDTVWTPNDTVTWQVRGDSVRLDNAHVVYALRGVQPSGDGMDMNYIELSDVNVAIDNLYNRGIVTTVPIKSLAARERCGVEIRKARGTFAMDESHMEARDFILSTMLSEITLDAAVDNSFLDVEHPSGNVRLATNSKIALQDVEKLLPDLRPMLKQVPQYRPIEFKGILSGTPQRIKIDEFVADMPRYARAEVKGVINNVMDIDNLAGDVQFAADLSNIDFVKPTLMDEAMGKQVNLPPMSLRGNAQFSGNSYAGAGNLKLATGELVADGKFNGTAESYNLDATFSHFPVHSLLPLTTVGDVTGRVQLSGTGFDINKPSTGINARLDLASVGYNNAVYKNLYADVHLNQGVASGKLKSNNKNCDVDVDFTGSIDGDRYTFDADGKVNELDLHALRLYDGVCKGRMDLQASGTVNLKTMENDVKMNMSNLNWTLDDDNFYTSNVVATFVSTTDRIDATLDNEDTHLTFAAPHGVDTLLARMNASTDIVMAQIEHRALNIDTLQAVLPKFDADLSIGKNGLVPRYLKKYDVRFADASLRMRNDSTIYIDGIARGINVQGTAIDTVTIHANELNNRYLAFEAHMGNRPGTWDEFANVDIHGGAFGPTVDFLVEQRNVKNEQGYRLGVNATLADSAVNMRFFPQEPVIGYKKWSINKDNYVGLNYHTMNLRADLKLQSDSSLVALTTAPHAGTNRDDIMLNVKNLIIDEWLSLAPFAPDVKGNVDADMRFTYDGSNLWGDGKIDVRQLVYERRKIGNLSLVSNLTLDPATGATNLDANLDLNGAKVAFAYGALNDSTKETPLNIALKLDRLPLDKLSPFIPGRLVWLRGYVNGELAVNGTMDKPIYNGNVTPDSAHIYLPRYGSRLRLTETPIPVENGVIKFNNFGIVGINDRQVQVNGTVDINDMSNMLIDMSLSGMNVQFVGSEQQRFSEVFGKGFADVACAVKGSTRSLKVNAGLTLLSTSNITYVLQEDVSEITASSNREMVTFINPVDSVDRDSLVSGSSMAMELLANIKIDDGAKINAYLSSDGTDRVTLTGNGALKYTMDFAGKDNLTGKLIVESGQVRYSPPVISQVTFDFESGSSIEWTGAMLNPQLHINATENKKASVSSSDGSSRLVDFVVGLSVGGTLNNMDLGFDLSASNDMTVANELQSMTAQQRSTAAMNLLLYNSYTGLGSGSGSMLGTGTLYSFLQSQLNNWAAKSLKGVDLSFGINQYQSLSSGQSRTETSYSYRLAKSLFNDRFKIAVGGEYSTEASSEQNFSQNLINDISFEYNLNESGTKYIRLFRHTGYESILEGEVTKMGVGFVMKRKVDDLRHLFRYKSKQRLYRDSIEAAEKLKAMHIADSLEQLEKTAEEK